MSGMLAPMGILSGPMADYFGQPVTEVTARFSWLTFGNMAGAVLALVVFNWATLRQIMTLTYVVLATCLISLTLVSNLSLIGISLGLVGVGCGVGLAGAALIISRSYDQEKRASMLIITDASFSVAGVVTSWLAVVLVSRAFHWAATYQFVALVAVTIVVLALTSTLPQTTPPKRDQPIKGDTWPLSVWLCIAALFLYTLGQWSILLWLPNYAEAVLGAPRDEAGALVGQFWSGMFAAQIFVAWWVLKIGVKRLVVFAGITTAVFSMPLWLYGEIGGLSMLAALWGFANLSLLKVTLSFATEMVELPSARLVSALLLGATLGTAISPLVTSKIVEWTSNAFILKFGSACYVAMAIILFVASREFQRGHLESAS